MAYAKTSIGVCTCYALISDDESCVNLETYAIRGSLLGGRLTNFALQTLEMCTRSCIWMLHLTIGGSRYVTLACKIW